MSGWLDMDKAPRDGTPIQAKIPGNGSDNIIAWLGPYLGEDLEHVWAWTMTEDQGWPDSWDEGVCWARNSDNVPSVQPTAWRPV